MNLMKSASCMSTGIAKSLFRKSRMAPWSCFDFFLSNAPSSIRCKPSRIAPSLKKACSYSISKASAPCFVKTSKLPRSPASLSPNAALRSPFVMAPNCFILRLTAATKRLSPPTSVTRTLNWGAESWFERCTRPSCCTAFSADQGNSMMSMSRCRGALPSCPPPASCSVSRRSACKEMPAEAASVMMATRLRPSWKALRSWSLMRLAPVEDLCTYSHRPPSFCSMRFMRPDSSATRSGPPKRVMSSSKGFPGRSGASARRRS
mmetsp:Transcript_2597/g.5662  ORF Transcript_2597/g.5662 Transcript_2597/m.5662 type:complete len:262 (-) Transcript_2597:2243-3028(-)